MGIENKGVPKEFKGGHEIGKSVSEFIGDSIKDLNFDEKESYGILLAVDEAVANIIDHAYQGKGGKVEIGVKRTEDKLIIKIRDTGKPFNPEKVKKYKPEDQSKNPQIRGRGLFLIKSLMDEVNFEFTPEGNILTLIKVF